MRKGYNEMIFYLVYNKVYNDLPTIMNNNSSFKLVKTTMAKGIGKKGKKWKIFVYSKHSS